MEIPKSIRAPAAASTPPRGRANLIHSPAFLLGLALLAMSVWAFLPAVDNDFVGYDDPDYITSNPWVQRGLSSASIRWAFTSTHAANWHPLTWLSHMLDVQFFGVNPAGHHLISILIHATSTLLAFALLRAMTGATWRSFFVAAFFGLHPLRVESVAWVAERKDVLSAMFWMFTLLAYAKFTQRPRPDRMRIVFYLLALFCFAVGLMAKPMLVTLPFVMLLCDYWPLARLGKTSSVTLLLEKLPFLLLSAVACFISTKA